MRQAWGRYFTRNPETGLKRASAEVFTPETPVRQPFLALQQSFPEVAAQLQHLAVEQERQLGDALVLDFVIEAGALVLGSVEPLERSSQAACKIAVALVAEGLISREQALLRVEPFELRSMLMGRLEDPPAEFLFRGESLMGGVASGRIVFSFRQAEGSLEPSILFCERLTYAQRGALDRVHGILVRSGPALAARHTERPCVLVAEEQLEEGQWVTMDASTGYVYAGDLPLRGGELTADAKILLDWADELRKVEIRANVATLEEARLAPQLGAQGVGLCRIESLFQISHRLPLFQKVLRQICHEKLERSSDYDQLTFELSQDVSELLSTTVGPFNLRLLDAPLSQMLRHWRETSDLPEDYFAGELATWLLELNPMQGLRCGRLSLLYPKLMEIQMRAILRAWSGHSMRLQVMLPGVCDAAELRIFRQRFQEVAGQEGVRLPELGSMLEIPRACLLAHELAAEVDFLSFGTGDLTEATCGI
ncbi:MAG: hypothetical protein J0I12_02395 [Candidatus Eremiobacteraeota bacterium]|nr:hypothetical protein [Candidatus Eremiobacteraeota bacterium]